MKQLSENDSKRVAQAWAEQYGKSLLTEAEAMREQGVSYQTPRADQAARSVAARRGRPARRRRTAMFMGLAAAACLVIVAGIAGISSLPIAPFTGPDDAAVDSLPPASDATKIPISFDLPAGYRVTATDYDNGTSLYTLRSTTHGDVVLAMSPENEQGTDAVTGAAPADADAESETSFGAMDEVVIDGTAVPAKVDEAYMLLAFEHEGVRYTLSDRDDMGALAAFYRVIVRAVP
jgi:hypothetical protein